MRRSDRLTIQRSQARLKRGKAFYVILSIVLGVLWFRASTPDYYPDATPSNAPVCIIEP